MVNSGIMNIDINKLKKKVAEKLGISTSELEIELEKIKAETDGVAGDRTALLILLERQGIKDKDLIEEIVMGDSITTIEELTKGSKVATVIARVMRILPEKMSRSNNLFGRAVIEDYTGKAILYIFGRSLSTFKSIGVDVGDIILVKRAKVRGKLGEYLTLISDDDTVIEIPDEKRFSEVIQQLPDPPIVLSVYEFLDSLEIFGEGDEINIEGVIESKGEVREFTRQDGKKGLVLNFILGDIKVPSGTVRVVAWDELASFVEKNTQTGQIIKIYGARLRSNFDQFGNPRLELHLGRLTSVKVVGEKRVKINETFSHQDERVVIYGVVITPPSIREFEKNGEVRQYAVFRISDDTGRIRTVVWDINGEKSKFESLKIGNLVRVYGRVSITDDNRVELHVNKPKNVKVLPENYQVDFDKDEILEKLERATEIQSVTLTNFMEIPEEGFVNLKGRVAIVTIPDNEKFPCQLIIEDDKGNALKVIGWERDLFEKIYDFGMGAKISITNLKIDRDKVTGERILKATRRTEISKIEEPPQQFEVTEEFTDARSLLAKRKRKEIPYLRDADLTLSSSKFIASIIMINRAGRRRFCLSCGAPILEDQEICENGHVGPGEELIYVDVIIDDGVKSYEAIINTKAVGIDSEKEFLYYIEEIIGLDMVFEADPKIRRDGSIYLIVKRIEPLDYDYGINYLEKLTEGKMD